MRHTGISTLCVFLLALTNSRAANHHPLKLNAWKPACELAGQLKSVTSVALTTIHRHQQESDASRKTAYAVLLYAAANKDAAADIAAEGLATALFQHSEAQQATAASSMRIGLTATQSAAQLSGAITATIDFLAAASHDAVYCLGNSAGSADDAANRRRYGCSYALAEPTADAQLLRSPAVDSKGFAELSDVVDGSTVDSSAQDKCIVTEHGSDHTKLLNDAGHNNKLVGGLFDFTTGRQAKRSGYATVAPKGERATQEVQATAFHDYAELRAAYKSKATTDPVELIAAVAASDYLKPAVAEYLASTSGATKPTNHEAMASAIIDKHYKNNGDGIKNLWERIKNTQVLDITKANGIKTKIVQIGTASTLLRTLALYNREALAKISKLEAAAAEKPTAKTTKEKAPTEEQCMHHETTGTCQNEGCEFDETKTPRCFPKPSETKEEKKDKQDGKTNTTANDSIVINKAPPLIAFILF
uniref:Variant surface glycoprotein 1125.393 n=1 Tax=Trypanosoma brucei TaxID=5691 RepID=A0A1J0R4F6_9TRYP|nr:variant surface glycoprotein 1125.393 [Trypanosoma brucei]